MIAATKLLAISITVLSGFRGGFIFPLFLVGTSLGGAVAGFHIPFISGLPPVLLAMCFAAGEALPPPSPHTPTHPTTPWGWGCTSHKSRDRCSAKRCCYQGVGGFLHLQCDVGKDSD